jgi:hypothetical protein
VIQECGGAPLWPDRDSGDNRATRIRLRCTGWCGGSGKANGIANQSLRRTAERTRCTVELGLKNQGGREELQLEHGGATLKARQGQLAGD